MSDRALTTLDFDGVICSPPFVRLIFLMTACVPTWNRSAGAGSSMLPSVCEAMIRILSSVASAASTAAMDCGLPTDSGIAKFG